DLSHRRSLGRSGSPHRQGRRARDQAVAEGIRSLARAGAARRQGADASLPAEGAVGRTHRRTIFASLCPPAPPEDRGRSGAPAIRADRDRHRLSVAGAGLVVFSDDSSLLPLWEKVARIDRCATDEGSPSAETNPSPRFAARSNPLPQGERVSGG